MDGPEASARRTFGLGERDRAADARDRTSEGHDRAADERDARASIRDARADARDALGETGPERDGAAAADRAASRQDRVDSAGNRTHASDEREAASADRVHSALERAELLLDGLTGAHRRDPGLLELERDVLKAHRTGTALVLAFVDVDGLKALNDARGHAAGDALLSAVVRALRDVLREYDLVVRYGGDEFLCGLLGLSAADARLRFRAADACLEREHDARISVGLAALEPDETLEDLVARADAQMYAGRADRRAARP